MFRLHNFVRTLFTVLLIGVILATISALWVRYQVDPITRDGKVRADIVPVAADVSGLITDVLVHDNEAVHQGQVLLIIDQPRYKIALQHAQANLDNQQAALAFARQQAARFQTLATQGWGTVQNAQQFSSQLHEQQAAVAEATAERDLAQLNLERTEIKAPVDGTVTNMELRPGSYLNAGKAAMALVYNQSLRVDGYFEETKLPAIQIGDHASVYLMGVATEIHGHVESIAGAVVDRERAGGEAELANVNPAFTWVRLAQRIPVRIVIDSLPPGVRLIPGQTATVEIHIKPDDLQITRSLPW